MGVFLQLWPPPAAVAALSAAVVRSRCRPLPLTAALTQALATVRSRRPQPCSPSTAIDRSRVHKSVMPAIGGTDPADLETKARAELGFSWQLEQSRRIAPPPVLEAA